MKKNLFVVALMALVVVLGAGCSATRSVVTEYDAGGNVVKVTETTESVIKEVTASTQGKTVVAWESGWAAYMSVSTATTEDPTPTAKMGAGKTDKGLISALPDQQNWEGIANVVNATKYDFELSTRGVKNGSPQEPDKLDKYAKELPGDDSAVRKESPLPDSKE